MKHEIGCSTLGWHFFDLKTALSEMRALRFGVVDIAMIPTFCPHFDPLKASRSEKAELKRTVQESGFRIATLNTFSGFLGAGPDRDSALEFLRSSMELAKDLGAYGLCVQSGQPRPEREWDEAAQSLARDLRLLGEEAGRFGLDIAVELHRDMLVSDTTEALKLMRLVDHPRIGITLDPCHVVCAGEDPALAAKKLGSMVRHVHLRDAISKNTEVVPGDGEVDVKALVTALEGIGYKRPMMVELEYPAKPAKPQLATVRRDAERARKLVRAILDAM